MYIYTCGSPPPPKKKKKKKNQQQTNTQAWDLARVWAHCRRVVTDSPLYSANRMEVTVGTPSNLPTLSPSLIGHPASVDVKQHKSFLQSHILKAEVVFMCPHQPLWACLLDVKWQCSQIWWLIFFIFFLLSFCFSLCFVLTSPSSFSSVFLFFFFLDAWMVSCCWWQSITLGLSWLLT